jgi:purine-binding chemotaxis protein CheW
MDTLPVLRDRIAAGDPLQVVTLSLSGVRYAMDVLVVEEVVSDLTIHPLPDAPRALVGVLSLRGEFVPVVDIGPALGLRPTQTASAAVVVLTLGESRVGVVAEEVSEVIHVEPGDVQSPGSRDSVRDVRSLGVVRLGGALLTLIDPIELMAETIGFDGEETP